jgi:peptide/nickel transport system ATP-binding protein
VGVKKGKNLIHAVRDIGFHIDPGEILGMAGESGCGKSLTALALAGLLPGGTARTAGAVFLRGRNLCAMTDRELRRVRGREIALIFQEPALSLNPLIKIGKQIAESLELQGEGDKAAIPDRVFALMDKLGMEHPQRLAQCYPHQLSGGACQRALIALAVIGKPKLLIADEPVTALDTTTQSQILDLLRSINREWGTGILFISHDLGLISRLCNRVLVMYAGRIVETGPAGAVFGHPAHAYTKDLLGAIPSWERKGTPLLNIPGKVPALEAYGPGCPFAPRCAKAGARCRAAFPEAVRLEPRRRVYCFAPELEQDA